MRQTWRQRYRLVSRRLPPAGKLWTGCLETVPPAGRKRRSPTGDCPNGPGCPPAGSAEVRLEPRGRRVHAPLKVSEVARRRQMISSQHPMFEAVPFCRFRPGGRNRSSADETAGDRRQFQDSSADSPDFAAPFPRTGPHRRSIRVRPAAGEVASTSALRRSEQPSKPVNRNLRASALIPKGDSEPLLWHGFDGTAGEPDAAGRPVPA